MRRRASGQIGGATIRAEAVTHRGPTLGYRITDGDTTVCYIPDHEPGLGADLAELNEEWISGYNLARDADLLIHDCQYTDEEYPGHEGWGHSPINETHHLREAGRGEADAAVPPRPAPHRRLPRRPPSQRPQLLADLGGDPGQIEMAAERGELTVGGTPAADRAAAAAPRSIAV